ncbi:helix-turn-helix transcriptional regulator [archaeon]|nr:helix-turn-helix transcriptional regulator [archaeon]
MGDNNNLRIGSNLKKLMAQKEVTLQEVVRDTGIPKSSLFGYTQNSIPRSTTNLRKICTYFGVTADELIFGTRISVNRVIQKGDIIEGKFKVIDVTVHDKSV